MTANNNNYYALLLPTEHDDLETELFQAAGMIGKAMASFVNEVDSCVRLVSGFGHTVPKCN